MIETVLDYYNLLVENNIQVDLKYPSMHIYNIPHSNLELFITDDELEMKFTCFLDSYYDKKLSKQIIDFGNSLIRNKKINDFLL